MTLIQVLLTLGLSAFFIYGISHKEMIGLLRIFLSIIPLAGITLVWNPKLANDIAIMVGVGRGADLMLYCWVIISLIILFNLHIRLHILNKQIVILTRNLAIHEMINTPCCKNQGNL